jgi:hypothetical protein
MDPETAKAVKCITDDCKVWHQHFYMPHGDQVVDISCAANGRHSVTPSNATNQPTRFPTDSVYRFDIKYKGMASADELIRALKHPNVHPGCNLIKRGGQPISTSVKVGIWLLSCDQHVGSCVNEDNFVDGKLAQENIMHPSMKKTKSSGTTNKDTVGMAPRKDRRHIAQLGQYEVPTEEKPKPTSRRTTSGKTEVACKMHIRIFLSHIDDYFYLSTSSDMTHNGHIELPNNCIPQNESHLSEEDLSMVYHMFNCDIHASNVSRVLSQMKGKHDTLIKVKTISNIRTKSMNLIDSSLGITSDMNDADKTLKKIQE